MPAVQPPSAEDDPACLGRIGKVGARFAPVVIIDQAYIQGPIRIIPDIQAQEDVANWLSGHAGQIEANEGYHVWMAFDQQHVLAAVVAIRIGLVDVGVRYRVQHHLPAFLRGSWLRRAAGLGRH